MTPLVLLEKEAAAKVPAAQQQLPAPGRGEDDRTVRVDKNINIVSYFIDRWVVGAGGVQAVPCWARCVKQVC